MRIEIEIPKEFERDYTRDTFKDFFSRVLCDIDNMGMCGKYEEEITKMFIKAFDESKLAYDIDKVVEELEIERFRSNYEQEDLVYDKAIKIVRGEMYEID